MVIEAMQSEPEAEGFFISGFPRDIVQAQGFEERVSVVWSAFTPETINKVTTYNKKIRL